MALRLSGVRPGAAIDGLVSTAGRPWWEAVAVPPDHREIARVFAEELAASDDVLAVLLVGSAARGNEIATSDVDLLAVVRAAGAKRTKPRVLRDGCLVEMWAKTEAEWEERFRRVRPMWVYSFLEADVLYDTGPATRLRSAAQSAYDDYETPEQLREELARTLLHGEPKLRRALEAGGEQAGYWASIFLPGILDGLYAVHGRPPPAGSRRLDLLHTVPLSDVTRRQVTVSCTGSADERLSAIAALYEIVTQHLGPPNLEGA